MQLFTHIDNRSDQWGCVARLLQPSSIRRKHNLSFFREFAKEKERVESRAGFMALKEQQKLEKELTGYVEWICRAGEL